MTVLDIHYAARPHDTSVLAAYGAALVLMLALGLPALMAAPSEVAPETWRGNAAGFTLAE